MPEDENDDILEIRTGGTPLRAERRLPALADEIPAATEAAAIPGENRQQAAPQPANYPIMGSDPSGLTPSPVQATPEWIPSSQVYGPGDAWLGRVVGADVELGAAQSRTVERSMLTYSTNNAIVLGAAPSASGQPTIGVGGALPFPARHDQAGYVVSIGDAVLVTTGRDGRRYFLSDELPFIGTVKSVDYENSTIEVTHQSLAGDPDGEDFHGATLDDLADSEGADVDISEVLVLRGAVPPVGDNIWVHRRGQYYCVDGRDGILIRNDTGVPQERFAVLRVGQPLTDPAEDLEKFSSVIAFSGVEPDATAAGGYFAITAIALEDTEVGPATISGPTIVKIDVGEGETGREYAEAKAGETGFLQPIAHNTSGTMILWKEAGIGEKWAIVRMSNPTTLLPA